MKYVPNFRKSLLWKTRPSNIANKCRIWLQNSLEQIYLLSVLSLEKSVYWFLIWRFCQLMFPHMQKLVISTWTGLRPEHIFYEHRYRYPHTCKLEYVYIAVTMLLVLDQWGDGAAEISVNISMSSSKLGASPFSLSMWTSLGIPHSKASVVLSDMAQCSADDAVESQAS